MTVKEASVKWGVAKCRVMQWIYQDRVPGAELRILPGGRRYWAIPDGAVRPLDKRMKGRRTMREGVSSEG